VIVGLDGVAETLADSPMALRVPLKLNRIAKPLPWSWPDAQDRDALGVF